uniref:Mitochondrial carrier protein n=1 Tax=Hemiselmis andersenii TaxID=464988 RepID=A0A6T8K9Z2_HEMAN|mmetsp:Transcript_40318/g.94376  ORF Transcript_40318/g.94376 Transcript_40318/m.94376 type:complete len:316 (+) Transcript_40318:300-1247(+)
MQPIFPKEPKEPPRLQQHVQYYEDRPQYKVVQPVTPVVALTWKQHLLAGGLSRGAAVTSMFPIDTVKTRLQMTGGALRDMMKPPYYSGYNAAIASQIPYGMAVFGTYEATKGILMEKFPQANKLSLFFVAAVAGDMVGSTVLTPGEVVKQKVQAGVYKDPLQACIQIFKNSGLRGFYQGYTSLVARDVPFRAIQLPLYETFKKLYADARCNGNQDGIGPLQASILGASSGMIGAALTNPVDVIKTQMMVGSGDGGKATVVQAVTKILKENPAAFLAGMPQRVGFLGGSSAVFFITYEFIRGTIQNGITVDMDMLG